MTTCYVVLCHTDRDAVLRLVRRIRQLSPSSHVIVRFDVAGLLDPADVAAAGGVALVSSTKVRWGDWSMVEAALEALGFALEHSRADRFVVVSGQCYPLRHLATWEQELDREGVDMVLDPIVDHPDDHYYRWRIVSAPPFPPFLTRVVRHLGWRVGRVTQPRVQIHPRFTGGSAERRWWIGIPRRSYAGTAPGGLEIRKASQWMVLSRRAAERALARLKSDARLKAFFRTVRIPDESTLQSLVAADPELLVREAVVSAKRFPPGASSPVWLTPEEMRAHVQSGAPFARKIPPGVDMETLAIADEAAKQ